MFFKNKTETLLKELEEKFQTLDQKITTGNHQVNEVNQTITTGNHQINEMNQTIKQLQTIVQKHDMAIEDLLDEWNEKESEENSVKEQIQEYKNNERHLLELFEVYEEQFFSIKRFAINTKEEAFTEQLSLMKKNLEHYQKLCGITIIEQCGVEVDYDLHEVLEVIDTHDPSKDKIIADIYRYGYLYKGKVMKKAQVAAYHITK